MKFNFLTKGLHIGGIQTSASMWRKIDKGSQDKGVFWYKNKLWKMNSKNYLLSIGQMFSSSRGKYFELEFKLYTLNVQTSTENTCHDSC